MLLTEKTIAKAFRLVVGGEIWWKKEHVVTEFVNQFLLPDRKNPNWNRGVPCSWIRPEWNTALIIIHKNKALYLMRNGMNLYLFLKNLYPQLFE
jgi:hypothetical protein